MLEEQRRSLSARGGSELDLVQLDALRGAMLGAELGRTDEARRDFAQAREQLKLALGDKPSRDLGPNWPRTYRGKVMRREAEGLFKVRGIPLPEPDAK